MNRRIPPCLAALGLLVLGGAGGAPEARAQDPCQVRLQEAEAAYAAGRLREVEALVAPCLTPGAQAREKVHAYELLARAHLALDELDLAREAIRGLLRLDPGYQAPAVESPRLVRLVAEVRAASGTVQVTSVSKTGESLREAPGTVVVLTAEEIERRGYLDLEALIHDLPGFAVARTNGISYANLYQRGYRSASTDRTLLLVDGVEQNDLTANIAYLSRQFPLSDVARVEVIYGPGSTIYGANAFTGVINVITRTPEEVLGDDGRLWAVESYVGGGSFDTGYLDLVAAGRTPSGSAAWSVTGRLYRSDEPDLSGFPSWDYDPAVFDTLDYAGALSVTGLLADGTPAAQALLDEQEDAPPEASPYYRIVRDGQGVATAILPTEAGLARALELDRAGYLEEVGGAPVGFSDSTDDRWLSARLTTTNLLIGFETWEREEGITPWYHDLAQPGADNGALWTPRQTSVYVKYGRELSPTLSLGFFNQYKKHDLGPESSTFTFESYGVGGLTVLDLADERPARWERTNLFRSSNQLRSELTLDWTPSERLAVVAGAELRDGKIQGDYVSSTEPVPSETGRDPDTPGGNSFDVRDLGFFAQATYRLRPSLKVVAGGRLDENTIRESGGYGAVFTPRLALVYSPGRWVFKGIYSEAFQDASNFNKFSTLPGVRDLPNPDLEPENVENVELAAGWSDEGFSAEVAVYEARYDNVVTLRTVPFGTGTTGQFQNLGELRIRGLQATADWRLGPWDLYGNYTYTDPVNTTPLDARGEPLVVDGRRVRELRIGDIPEHQLNLGVSRRLWERLDLHLRGNYVGDRPTGQGTTVPTNPLSEVGDYFATHTAVTYRGLLARGLDLQLYVENLLDADYYHPGVRQAGADFAARVPQPGRSAYLRLIYRR